MTSEGKTALYQVHDDYRWCVIDEKWFDGAEFLFLRYGRIIGFIYIFDGAGKCPAKAIGRQIKAIVKRVTPGWDLECLLRDL